MVKPYWESTCGRHQIFCDDCRNVLPHIGKVDAVVCDPPYGVGFIYASHDDSHEGYEDWCREWFKIIPCENILMSCGQVNVCMWARIKPFRWIAAWHKPAAMGRSPFGFCNWEPNILWGKPKGNSVDFFAAPIVPDSELDGHPCPKPLRWGRECVVRMSDVGETILDPFMGSGTTGVACEREGRRFLGIEIEKKYCDIAIRRIEEAMQTLWRKDEPKDVQLDLLT